MLRGLFSNWNKPIFYDYDCKMTKDILFDIINYVEDSGENTIYGCTYFYSGYYLSSAFHVVGVVSDLGGANRSLHKESEVTSEKTWLKNPEMTHLYSC